MIINLLLLCRKVEFIRAEVEAGSFINNSSVKLVFGLFLFKGK